MPRSATVGLYGKIIFNFVKNCQPLTNNERKYLLLHILARNYQGLFFFFANLKDVQWYHIVVLIWNSLMTWFGASFFLLYVHFLYWGVCLVITLYHKKLFSSALDMRIHPWLFFTLVFEQHLVFSLNWLSLNAFPVNDYCILCSKLKQLVVMVRPGGQWPWRSCY